MLYNLSYMPGFRQVLLPKTVQVLGHKNVTTTLQKYVDDTQKMQEAAGKLFENHVGMVQNSNQDDVLQFKLGKR